MDEEALNCLYDYSSKGNTRFVNKLVHDCHRPDAVFFIVSGMRPAALTGSIACGGPADAVTGALAPDLQETGRSATGFRLYPPDRLNARSRTKQRLTLSHKREASIISRKRKRKPPVHHGTGAKKESFETMKRTLIAFCVFLVLMVLVSTVDVAPIGPCQTRVGFSTVNGAVAGAIKYNGVFYLISQLLGYCCYVIAAGFAAMAVFQGFRRKAVMKIDRDLLAVMALYLGFLVCYLFFEIVVINRRPVLFPEQDFPEPSFPSTHSMLFMTVFGSTALLVKQYLKDPRMIRVFPIVCWTLAALGVVVRFLSGVHWTTDILGGVAMGITLLEAFVMVRGRRENI